MLTQPSWEGWGDRAINTRLSSCDANPSLVSHLMSPTYHIVYVYLGLGELVSKSMWFKKDILIDKRERDQHFPTKTLLFVKGADQMT